MAKQTFVNNSNISAPLMPLDSRDTQKRDEVAWFGTTNDSDYMPPLAIFRTKSPPPPFTIFIGNIYFEGI